jgi:sugar porter (SP) family MFS transporter
MRHLSKSRLWVYTVSAFAALAGLLFGYDTGVISGAILFIRHDFALTSGLIEITVSAVLLGALIGSGVSGRITDIFGRRKILIITAIIYIIGSISTALAPTIYWLITGRVILGFAIGLGSFTAPLYLAEIAPFHIRGMLVSLNQLAITVGIVLSYVIDFSFADTGDWRWMLGLGVIPAIILFIGSLFLPESPRWLVLRGWNHKARAVLKSIRNTEDVSHELAEIEQSIGQEKGTWRMLLAKWMRPIIFISLGLSFFQQTTGINTIIYYAPTVLEIAGFHKANGAILATLGVGLINVLFTIIALPLIDRWGRRPLLLLGLTGMFISLAAMGLAFHFQGLASLKWIAVCSMVLYIACFAMSLGPIMWLVISEIYPLEIRGMGVSAAVSISWGFNMLVALTFLTLIDLLGASGTFWIYAGLCIFGWLFVYLSVPETKGCTLEQIEHNLRLGKRSRDLGQTRQTIPSYSSKPKVA